jgi:hypothetical protein
MNTIIRLLPAAALAFNFASFAAARAATADNPCLTVSTSDVASVLGAPVRPAHPRLRGESASCTFRSAHFIPYVTITSYRYDTVPETISQYRSEIAAYETLGHLKTEHVAGIGDAADTADGVLYTRKGTAIYVFSVVDGTAQPGPLPKAERIAKRVLAKL